MSITQELLGNILRSANDPITNELKLMANNSQPQLMNVAADVAIKLGNALLARGGIQENVVVETIARAFRAVLYKRLNESNLAYYNNSNHQLLLNEYTNIANTVQQLGGLQNQPAQVLGLGTGSGGGLQITMPASAPAAAPGGIPVGGSGGISVVSSSSSPLNPLAPVPVATAPVVATTPAVETAPASLLGIPPSTAPALTPQPTKKWVPLTFERLITGDNMESFNAHNLLVLDETNVATPKNLNRQVSKFREQGNFIDGLIDGLQTTRAHNYPDAGILVTLEDRGSEFYLRNSILEFIATETGRITTVIEGAIKRARESDAVDTADDSLTTIMKEVTNFPTWAAEKCRDVLRTQSENVSLAEMSCVQNFLRHYLAAVEDRVVRTIRIATANGTDVPGMPNKEIVWDGNFDDLKFIQKDLYDKAAGENGLVEDADGFRNLFITIMCAVRSVGFTWNDYGVKVNNRTAIIWLPAHYASIDKGNSISNATLGNAQDPIQTIHDEIVAKMPDITVAFHTPEVGKVLVGAGDGSVIRYN